MRSLLVSPVLPAVSIEPILDTYFRTSAFWVVKSIKPSVQLRLCTRLRPGIRQRDNDLSTPHRRFGVRVRRGCSCKLVQLRLAESVQERYDVGEVVIPHGCVDDGCKE